MPLTDQKTNKTAISKSQITASDKAIGTMEIPMGRDGTEARKGRSSVTIMSKRAALTSISSRDPAERTGASTSPTTMRQGRIMGMARQGTIMEGIAMTPVSNSAKTGSRLDTTARASPPAGTEMNMSTLARDLEDIMGIVRITVIGTDPLTDRPVMAGMNTALVPKAEITGHTDTTAKMKVGEGTAIVHPKALVEIFETGQVAATTPTAAIPTGETATIRGSTGSKTKIPRGVLHTATTTCLAATKTGMNMSRLPEPSGEASSNLWIRPDARYRIPIHPATGESTIFPKC